MTTLTVLIGLYLMWFGLRTSIFNYDSEAAVRAGSSKDKQIYWGALPIFCLGICLVITSFGA